MVTAKQLRAFFKHLKTKYPMTQQITLKLYDVPYIKHPVMPSSGFCTSWSDRALIEVATRRDFPYDAAITLAHEYKHCIQRYLEGKDCGNISLGIQERNIQIEKEANLFAEQEVATLFPDYRKPTDEERAQAYIDKYCKQATN